MTDTGAALRVAFVYTRPRVELRDAIARGEAPDTGLLGQNHLAELGVEAHLLDSALRRQHHGRGLLHRLSWTARELTLPLEARGYDAICGTVGPTLALSSRTLRGPAVVLLNMSICQSIRRARDAKRRLLAAGVRAAGAVICFAEAQRDDLLGLSGADPKRVHAVGLGVDERFLTATGSSPHDGAVLAVGRDLSRDYATFAAAVGGIDARVVLVTSERNLKGVALPANVELLLDVSPAELRMLYEQAACVVVPTRREGYPYGADCSGQTVILDAFAMRRAVVTSKRSTLRGYVDDGRNGLVVPAEDPAALRAAVERVLGDEELARQLGQAGREDVEERFTTRHLARSLARVLSTMER
jgi:glycosyltransferase involved in cell wall biosynthesis